MRFKSRVLKNGTTLATITKLPTKAVTISAFIKAGFRFDPIEKPGLAHFTEHMVFNGTKSFPSALQESLALEKIGGWHTAYTWIEHQEHKVHVPKSHFKLGAKLLLETLAEPRIKISDIEKEKGVIREEILKNQSSPSRAIWDYVWLPLFFQNTRLARPYSGTQKDINNIAKNDVSIFLEKYFQPQNTQVLVAGDLEQTFIEQTLAEICQNFTRSIKNPYIGPINLQRKKKLLIYNDSSYHQSSIIIGAETVPYTSEVKYTFNIIREIIAGYFGSNLIQRLRNEGGLIYDWHTFSDTLSETGYLIFNASTAHENVEMVIKIVLEEFQRLASGNVRNEEIEIARNHLIGSILANIETGQDYIEWYGLQLLFTPRRVYSVEKMIKRYQKITIKEIKEALAQYFVRDKLLIGVLGKADEKRLAKLA